MEAKDVLTFWFDKLSPKQHFEKDKRLDALIAERFMEFHLSASRGELSIWRGTPDGRLAEIIVLDQFSRNIFRDRPETFACDGMALVLAQEAIHAGADQSLPATRKVSCICRICTANHREFTSLWCSYSISRGWSST